MTDVADPDDPIDLADALGGVDDPDFDGDAAADDDTPDEHRFESIYDSPKYYDLLFGSDWQAEYDFLVGCFDRYTNDSVQRVFEPACGTGRLLIRLARQGLVVGGCDLNEAAIAYCNDRLDKAGYGRPCVVGDMTAIDAGQLPGEGFVDASFNTINSFRHLGSEDLAAAHLTSLAEVTRPGGLYVLGLHLLPTRGTRSEEEAWTARRGTLQVNSYMWSKGLDGRDEILGMTLDIWTPTSHRRIEDEMRYFTYTREQLTGLLDRVGCWEIVATHDFAYDLSHPTLVDETTEDVVYVLRRR